MLISRMVNGKKEMTAHVEMADAIVYTSLDIRFISTGFHRRKYSRNASRVAGYVSKSNEELIVTPALCTAVVAIKVAN